jgi:hypothetical protein
MALDDDLWIDLPEGFDQLGGVMVAADLSYRDKDAV